MGGEGDSRETAAVDGGEATATEVGQELATVNVRCSNGSKFAVQTALDSTVGMFKSLLAQKCDVPADQQRLIYKGRILKDDQTLESYGLQADHTVHMVRGFTSTPATTAPGSGTANAGTTNTTSNATRTTTAPSNDGSGLGGAGLGASLFPGLSLGSNAGSGLFGAGFPEFEQVQQQLTQNPNMMREIMNMPAMQSLMNNPDLIRSLIMSNPQMRDIIDRNPELAHILNDPSILRQTMETARNPELMREMMRNTDRAMSNIESMPEGFNMLRRMYENVQEPFLNATTMSGDAGTNLSANPFAALLGNQVGGQQQRDGSNNPSTTDTDANAGAAPNTNPLPNPWGPNEHRPPLFLSLDNMQLTLQKYTLQISGGTQTNAAPRSNSSANRRPQGLGNLGGLAGLGGLGGGVPDLERMLSGGGAPDPALFNQVLQNPAMSQMMQSLLSNPEYMNQILNTSPQLRAMSDSNPQFREMMQNPELLRMLSSPEILQQMSTLQQTLLSQLNQPRANQDPSQTGGAAGNPNNMNLDMLMSMLGGLGTGGGAQVPPTPSPVPPEELYATQLSQLQEMGFFDTQENIRALRATSGNVHAAVEFLLGSFT
ncbi:hypothetical protein V2J09_015598 [Rumex salicifolius]